MDECDSLGETFCVDKTRFQSCGELDTDVCKDLSAPQTCPADHVCEDGECIPGCAEDCPAHFECIGSDCVCDTVDIDFDDTWPGWYMGYMDDSGVTMTDHDSLWPETDRDVVHYYLIDGGGSHNPAVTISDIAPGVKYDLCMAFQCDPEANDGTLDDLDCNGASKTVTNGVDSCCLYGVAGTATIEMNANCTFFGTGDDSGTVFVSVESTQGAQCWPHYHITVQGGN